MKIIYCVCENLVIPFYFGSGSGSKTLLAVEECLPRVIIDTCITRPDGPYCGLYKQELLYCELLAFQLLLVHY